jgi:hypothetical protein
MKKAFQVSEEDIEQVLRDYTYRVANTHGQSFEAMAGDLIDEIDHNRIAKAALAAGCDLDDQTRAAHAEIHRNLVELGVIEF